MTRMSGWLPITLLVLATSPMLVAADDVKLPIAPMSAAEASGSGDGKASSEKAAQDSPAATDSLPTPEIVTLETITPLFEPAMQSVVQQAIDNSPAIQQALADVQKARGLRFQSTRSPNPVAGYSAAEVGNEGYAGQQGVFWSQNFRVAEKLDLNDQIGHFDVQATTWNWQVEQARVAGSVQLAWYAAAAAAQRVALLEKLKSVLEGGVRTTKSLLDAGELGRGPYLQAQLELQQILLEIQNAESSLEGTRKQLAAIAAMPVDLLPGEFPGLNDSLGFVDEPSYIADLLANSPELHLARARIVEARYRICREQVEPVPDLQTQFSLQYDTSTKYTVGGIQLGVALPILDRNRGNISAASAEHIRACQEVRRKELELTRKSAAAYRDLAIANRDIQTIDTKLLPLAQDNLKATSDSFKLGESSYQNLLTAQRSYVELIVSRIDALRRARQAEAVIRSYLLAEQP
ncbi:MAG: TolC family protein [Planctomycetaceae bacterium]